MTQNEKANYLINYLLNESGFKADIPADENSKKRLLRALLNVRSPKAADENFLRVQNEYLQQEIKERGITDIAALSPVEKDLYLWKGDITALKCDAIVNAANSQMLGCFCPNHGCIDNAVHTFAGVQLRQECAHIMKTQGRNEPTGSAKITHSYNLPCKYVLHTVGPIVYGELTERDKCDLANCYRSCLALAEEHGLSSIAFCCISTGEYRFPGQIAAQIAVNTVREYKARKNSPIKVIFNVFKESDYAIYSKLLG